MNWFIKYFTSSIGQKLIMSLTGLFLIVFLKVHLLGNLQLLANDNGESFNVYAHMMTSNPLIKMISIGLYFFIIVHTIQGVLLWMKNRKSKSSTYKVKSGYKTTWASRNMALLGTLLLAFLLIHMGDFWYKMKFTSDLAIVNYGDIDVLNLYERVATAYTNPVMVIIYIVGMVVLGFHLWHGFQSAFQTLGINHKKYTPAIQFIGKAFAIVVPALFAAIPIIMYLNQQ